MDTDRKVFRNFSSAPGAELRRVFSWDSNNLPTSVFCFEGKYIKEPKPCDISHRPIENPKRKKGRHILMVDDIVFIEELISHLKVEVPSLVRYFFVGFGDKQSGFRPAFRALLPSGKSLLSHFQNLKSLLKETGIFNLIAVGSREEGLTADINPDFVSCRGKKFIGDALTGKGGIPPIGRAMGDSHGLNVSLDRPGELEFESANLVDFKIFTCQLPARLFQGKGMIAMLTLEARKSSLFTCFDTAKERLVCLIKALNDILKHLGADLLILREGKLKGGKLFNLTKPGRGFTRFLKGSDSFLKTKVVEFTAKKKPTGSIFDCLLVGIGTILKSFLSLHGLIIANTDEKGKPDRASPSVSPALKSGVLDGVIL